MSTAPMSVVTAMPTLADLERMFYEHKVSFMKAAAARLDISTSQVYNRVHRGELEAVRVGRALRIPVPCNRENRWRPKRANFIRAVQGG